MSLPQYNNQHASPLDAAPQHQHRPQSYKKPYVYDIDPGQYQAPPSVYSDPQRPPSSVPSEKAPARKKPLSIRDVDLNASQYSIGSSSSASTMRLGGVNYPVGSRIGSSGLFVIGPPVEPKTNLNQSQTSNRNSQDVLVQKQLGYVSQGYTFEEWNWETIRFSLFVLIVAFMVALMAATIGLSVRQTEKCSFGFEWWEGPAVYHIPVGLFRDYGSDGYGDLEGLDFSMSYLQQLGVKVLLLSHVLPSYIPAWDLYTSFRGLDTRLGSSAQMGQILQKLQKEGIRVILEMDVSYTSIGHQWFAQSERTSVNAGGQFENFYTWRNEVGIR